MPAPNEQQRDDAVDEVVDDANPRAVTALIAPGQPLDDDVKEEPELVQASDDAFVDGIRAAIGVSLLLVLGALVAGYFVFPRGRQEGARQTTAVHVD